MERIRVGNWEGLLFELNVGGKDGGWQLEMGGWEDNVLVGMWKTWV